MENYSRKYKIESILINNNVKESKNNTNNLNKKNIQKQNYDRTVSVSNKKKSVLDIEAISIYKKPNISLDNKIKERHERHERHERRETHETQQNQNIEINQNPNICDEQDIIKTKSFETEKKNNHNNYNIEQFRLDIINKISNYNNNNTENLYDLIICVFGCVTIDKYKKQVEKINETWGYESLQYPGKVKLLYFLGEEKTNLRGENYIYLPDVKNDYFSASYKQSLGLKYIKEKYNCKFVYICGTDTYVNIPKMLMFIQDYDYNDNLYIGGHGSYHNNFIQNNFYFHDGGAGFIITKDCLNKLYPYLNDMNSIWEKMCIEKKRTDYVPACDVAISYYLQKIINSRLIKVSSYIFCGNNFFVENNQNLMKCLKENITMHPLSLSNFDELTSIFKKNTFYL